MCWWTLFSWLSEVGYPISICSKRASGFWRRVAFPSESSQSRSETRKTAWFENTKMICRVSSRIPCTCLLLKPDNVSTIFTSARWMNNASIRRRRKNSFPESLIEMLPTYFAGSVWKKKFFSFKSLDQHFKVRVRALVRPFLIFWTRPQSDCYDSTWYCLVLLIRRLLKSRGIVIVARHWTSRSYCR